MQTSIHRKRSGIPAPLRRERGTPVVGIQVNLAEDAKDLLDHYTALTGLPQWAIIEAALRAGRPGSSGYPEDWDLPAAIRPAELDFIQPGGEQIRRTA